MCPLPKYFAIHTSDRRTQDSNRISNPQTRKNETSYSEVAQMILLLIVLILVFGFGGYRMGPGLGYYGGGGLSLILTIVLILLLLKVF